jgi:hypothetical protein
VNVICDFELEAEPRLETRRLGFGRVGDLGWGSERKPECGIPLNPSKMNEKYKYECLTIICVLIILNSF